MEPDVSLPSAQEPSLARTASLMNTTTLYHILFPISSHLRLDRPSDLFPSGFYNQNALRMRTACSADLIRLEYIILIFVNKTNYMACYITVANMPVGQLGVWSAYH
jgi:hypothetical protein